MAKTQAVMENGHNVFAGPGAVNQHSGSLRVMWCNDCHSQVAWCTSKKTGNYYLVNIRENYNGARFYMGHDIHKCGREEATE